MFVISEFLSNGKPKVLSSSVIVPSPVMSHILSENMYNACKRAIRGLEMAQMIFHEY